MINVLTLANKYKNTGIPPIKMAAGTRPRYCWHSNRAESIGATDKGGCCDTLCSGAETTLKPGWPGNRFLTTAKNKNVIYTDRKKLVNILITLINMLKFTQVNKLTSWICDSLRI